jgi:hypothetical protein
VDTGKEQPLAGLKWVNKGTCNSSLESCMGFIKNVISSSILLLFVFLVLFLQKRAKKKKAFIFQNKKLFYAYKGIFLRFGKHFLLINIL